MTKLKELYLKVYLSCDLPTYEQTFIYAELFALFKEIDNQVKSDGQLTRMPYKAASKVIQAIRKSRSFPIKNDPNSLALVASKMREALKIHMYVAENFPCALKALVEDNFHGTNALLKASRHIQINLVQLEIVAGLCAFNAANSSAEAIKLEFSHINDMVVSIVNKMQKWIPLQLNMTWPSISTVAAKTSIYEQEEINPSSYNKVADRVKSAVDKVGFPGYDHQVVIWSNNVQFGAICPSDSCINIVDYKNINALIVRSRETSRFNTSLQINQWLQDNGEKVTQILNDNVSNGNLTYILHQADPVEDVKDMLAQFTNFTESADDSLGKLKLISDQNPEFISRIEKVGALINLGTNANYTASDQEKVALRILHSFLKQQLPRLGILVIRIINKLECSLTLENYHKHVTIPMLDFLPVIYAITDPAENRTRWLDTFKAKCGSWKSQDSLERILTFFRHSFNRCVTPAELEEIFTRMNRPTYGSGNVVDRYVERYHEISAGLDCKFYSSCLLLDTLESSGYRRQRLLDMSDAIRIDLIRLQLMVGSVSAWNLKNTVTCNICTRNPRMLLPKLQINLQLDSSIIGTTPNIDRENYQSLAEEILTIAQERGPPDFTYQVLVTDASLQTETVCNPHKAANQWIAANKYNIIEVFRENGSSDSLNQTLHALDHQELYLKVDLSCDLPTYEQTSIYAELFSLFKEIDDQVGDYRTFSGQNYHYDPFRSKVMGQLTRMPYKAASKVIQAIRKKVFPIKNHLYSLAKVAGKMREALKIHMYVAENFRCALKALIEDNFYETNALLKASRHIQINLVQLEIVAGLCAFNAANNSAEAIELEFSHINDMVVSIVNKMQKWIPLQLNMTWPSITTVAAKTSIYEQEEINPSSYNKVADRVKSAVDKVGFPGYDHQVVIWSNNVQFGAKCPSDSCINIVDYKNINALIVRSRETSPFNASLQISQWLHNNGEKVTQILNDNVSNGNLTYILHQVNTTMKDVVNKTMFRAALIIKNQNLLASKTIINIGEDSFKEWINSTKNTVDYFTTDMLVKAIPVEDVDDMLAQFTNFTELADDRTNANYSATDQEKVALRILHSFLKQQLPRLGIVVIRIINKLECSLTSENYHKFVTIPMLNFLPVFYAITDPAENRTRWLDTFKAKCARWAKGSPSEILSFFRHYAIRTCMTPAKLQELFTEFNHVAELDCKFYSSCLLEDTLESSGYRRQRLLDMSDAIRIDLIRSEIMAGICLSLESRSPSDTERENNYLNEGVVKSADKIYNWIPPSLEVAWPRITALFVQRAIEATPNIDRKNYQSLAEEILTIAQERDA
uniref:Uncharacterized protein n=1 Tax=Ditylenchus dipsaci TaxID=166011 RepID=A0A915DUT3_9BILA